jgi:hypothetical protein
MGSGREFDDLPGNGPPCIGRLGVRGEQLAGVAPVVAGVPLHGVTTQVNEAGHGAEHGPSVFEQQGFDLCGIRRVGDP